MIWATLTFGAFGQLSMGTTLLINLVAALLIVLFGFLFVTVSSRLTGEIGSSSNPISGMTVATLLLTCLTFLALGWVNPPHRLIALSIAAIVCIAASNGGTTSQDLKTGYLVGATPKLPAVGDSRGLDFLGPGDRRDPDRAESGGHGLYDASKYVPHLAASAGRERA